MVVKITFESIVETIGKKSSMSDFVEVHSTGVEEAKDTFNTWISKGVGIRGASGVYHPILDGGGKIKVKDVRDISSGPSKTTKKKAKA